MGSCRRHKAAPAWAYALYSHSEQEDYSVELGMVAHGFNPRLRKPIQEDVFEFQARLVYTANLRPAWSTQ